MQDNPAHSAEAERPDTVEEAPRRPWGFVVFALLMLATGMAVVPTP
ncbi:hypothetical protein H4F99_10110 [Lysobacter sp. SG-8]|uniref:Uncharacterized protein n=1 Tax=Marilutibacter penaei TaxID=2759900 RepID=A0A7W3YEI7_9GAMM|nr:hypothetical protein [Lysobacter penaei]MBB1088844.1 hypothetical protein [Lysobacter penaei]